MAMAGGDAANQCQCEIHVNWAKWYKGFMHQVFLHTKMEMKKVLDRKKTSEVREPDGELSVTVLVSQTNSRIQFTMDLTEEAKELKKANIKDLQELKKRIVQVIKYRIRAFHYQDFYDVAPMLVPKIMAEGKGGSLESVVDFANFNFGNIPGTKVAIMQRPVAEGKITALKKTLFDKWGLTGKLAFLLASYNMYRLWTKGEKHFGLHELFETVKDGVYKVKLGEKDKSLAAATLFTMARFMDDLDVDGDLVIVIPVPSVLLVTGSRNYDGLCYMGEHVLSLARNKDLITRKPIRIAHAGEGKAHGPMYSSYRPLLPNGEGSVPENAEQLKILTDGLSRRARASKLAAASTSESASARETPVPQACEGDSQKNLPSPPPSSPQCTDKTTQETITAVRLENVRKELDGIRRENTASPIPAEKQRRPVTLNNAKPNTAMPETQQLTQKQTQETQKQTQDVTQKQTQDVSQKQTQDVTQKQIQDVSQKQTQDVPQKQAQDVTQKQTQDVTQKQTQDVTQKLTQDVTQKLAQDVTQKKIQETQKKTQDVTQKQTAQQETQKQEQEGTQKRTQVTDCEQTVKQTVDVVTAVPIATKSPITTKAENKVTSFGDDALVPPTRAPPGGPHEVAVTQPQLKQDGSDIAVKQGKGQGDVIAICRPLTKTTPPPVSTTSKADESRVPTTSGHNGTSNVTGNVVTTVIYSKCCSLRLPVTVTVSATNTRLLPDTKVTSQVATTATPSKTSASDISVHHEKTPPSTTQAPGTVTSKQAAQPSDGTVKSAEEQMPGPKQTHAPTAIELLSTSKKQILATKLSPKPALEHVQSNAVVGKQNHLEDTTNRLVGSRVDAKCLKESSAMRQQLPSSNNVPVASSATPLGVTRGVPESASLKLQHTDGEVVTNSLTSSAEEKVDQKLVPIPHQQPDLDKPVSVGQLKPDSTKTTICSKLHDTTVASTAASQVKSAPEKPVAAPGTPEKIAPFTKLQTAPVKPAVSTDGVTSSQVQTRVPEKAQVQSTAVKPLTTSSQVQQPAVKSAVSAQIQSTAVSSTAPFQMQEAAAKSPEASQAESTSEKSQISSQKQPAVLKMAANLQIPPAATKTAKPLPAQLSSAPTPTVSQPGAPKQVPPLQVQTDIPKPSTTSELQPTVTKPVTSTPTEKQADFDSSTASTNKNPVVLMTPAKSSAIQSPVVQQMTSAQAINRDPKTVASKAMSSCVAEQTSLVTSCPATLPHTVRPPVPVQLMQMTASKQDASPCLQSTVPKSLSSSVQSACPTTRTSLEAKTTVVPSVESMPLKYSKAPQTQLVTSATETDDAAHKQVTSAQTPCIVPKHATKSEPESYKMAASIPLPLQETALKQTVKKVSPPALPSKPSISFGGKDVPKLAESSEVKVSNAVHLPIGHGSANQQAATTLPHTTKQPIGDAVTHGSQSQRQDADVMPKSSDTVTSPGKKLSVRMVPYVAPPPRGLQGPTIEMLATSEKQQQSVVPKPATTSDELMESSSFGDKKPTAKTPSLSTSAEAERKTMISTKMTSPTAFCSKPANEATVSSKLASTPEASPKTSAPPAVPKPAATAAPASQESLGQKVKTEMEALNNNVVSTTEPKIVLSCEKPGATNALSPETGRNVLSVKMAPYKPIKMAPYTPPAQNSTSQSAPPCDNLERNKKCQSPTEEVKQAAQQHPIQEKSSSKSDHDLTKNGTAGSTKIQIPPDVKKEKLKESLNPNALTFNSKNTVDAESVVATKPSVVAPVTENRVCTAQELPESTTPQIQHQGQQTTQQRPLAVYHGTANSNGLVCTEVVRPKEQTQAGTRQMPHRNDVLANQSWPNHGEQQQAHQQTWDRDNYPDAACPQEDPNMQRTTEKGQTTKGKLVSAFKPLADKFQQFKQWRKNKNQQREEPYVTESYNLEHQVQEGMGDALSNIGHWDGNAQYQGQLNGYGMPPADQPGTAQDWTYEQRQWYQEQVRLRDMNREMYGVTDPNASARMSGQAYSGQGWNDNSHYGQRNVVNPVIKTKTTRQQVPQHQQWSQGAPPSDYQGYGNPDGTGATNQQRGYNASMDGNPFNKATWRNYRGRNASEPNRSHTQNTQRYDRMSQNSNQDMSARDAQRPTNNNARSGEPEVRRSASFSRSGPRAHGRTPKGSSAVYGEPAVQQLEMQTWIGGGRVTNLPTGTAPPTPPRYYRSRANSHSYSQSRPYQTQTKPIEETKPPTKPTAKKSKPTPQPERGRKNTLTKGAHSRQATDTVPQSTNYEKPTQKLDTSTRPKTPNPKSDPPSQVSTTKPEQIESEKPEEVVDEEEERKALKARRRLLTRKPSDAQKSRPAKIPRIPVFLGAIEAGVREEAWNRALVTAEEDPLVGTSLCVQLCFFCGVVGSWNEDVVLKKCSRCGTASYCSRKCQWNHWNHHKSKCRNLTTDHQKFKVIIQL